jgi:hypothetical protein
VVAHIRVVLNEDDESAPAAEVLPEELYAEFGWAPRAEVARALFA